MNEATGALLIQGLRITAIGMAWVFLGLALIWALVTLLDRLFPAKAESRGHPPAVESPQVGTALVEVPASDALTLERSRVAVAAAAALLSNALPLTFEAPVGSVFEHGRTAPNWVTGNRARALQSWQPPRRPGGEPS